MLRRLLFKMTNKDKLPKKAQEILKQNGTEVTLEEATLIVEFMRKLADIAVTQYLEGEEYE
jgi:hypothetical protein